MTVHKTAIWKEHIRIWRGTMIRPGRLMINPNCMSMQPRGAICFPKARLTIASPPHRRPDDQQTAVRSINLNLDPGSPQLLSLSSTPLLDMGAMHDSEPGTYAVYDPSLCLQYIGLSRWDMGTHAYWACMIAWTCNMGMRHAGMTKWLNAMHTA